MTPSSRLKTKRRPWTVLLLLTCQSVLSIACTAGQLLAVSEGPEPVACSMHGETCAQSGDCCSDYCVNSQCAALPACGVAGNACVGNSDCCSGDCDATETCVTLPGCRVEGERCDNNGQCCSSACANSTVFDPSLSGSKRCQSVDGCRPLGELCNTNTECCSNFCNTDSNSTNSVFRCQLQGASNCIAPGQPCQTPEQCCSGTCDADPNSMAGELHCGAGSFYLNPGEVCGASSLRCWSPNPSAASIDSDCQETKSGVLRCRSFEANPQYETVGTLCSTASQCCAPSSTSPACSWFCLPTVGGQTECGETCVAEGGGCRAASDCCTDRGPIACHDGQCRLTGIACQQLGQTCAVASDCCSGQCSGVNGPFAGTYCIAQP